MAMHRVSYTVGTHSVHNVCINYRLKKHFNRSSHWKVKVSPQCSWKCSPRL